MSWALMILLLAFPDTHAKSWGDVHGDDRCVYGTLDAVAPEYVGPIPAQYYAACDDGSLWVTSDGQWWLLATAGL